MAITLEATAGSATANSYATLAEAESYFEAHANAAAWDALDGDEAKKACLITATNRLEQEQYLGSRSDEDQRLAWPREGIIDDGLEVDSETIPRFLREACLEEALAVAAQPARYDTNGLAQFESLSAGPISLTTRTGAMGSNALTPAASRLLARVRKGGGGSFAWMRG